MFGLCRLRIKDVRNEGVEDDETTDVDEEHPDVSAASQSDGGSEDDVQSEGAGVHQSRHDRCRHANLPHLHVVIFLSPRH